MNYGIEVEYFVTLSGSIAYAKLLVPETDSNCSIAEISSDVFRNVSGLVGDISTRFAQHATNIVRLNPYIALESTFLLTPFTWIDVDYGNGMTPLFKTAGVHLNISGQSFSPEQQSRVVDRFNNLIKPRLNYLSRARSECVVIGPQSGNVYSYGANERCWKYKTPNSGAPDHYEFRMFPSGNWVFDTRALELAFYFIQGINLSNNEIDYLVNKVNEVGEFPALSFLKKKEYSTTLIYHMGTSNLFFPEKIDIVTVPDYDVLPKRILTYSDKEMKLRLSRIHLLERPGLLSEGLLVHDELLPSLIRRLKHCTIDDNASLNLNDFVPEQYTLTLLRHQSPPKRWLDDIRVGQYKIYRKSTVLHPFFLDDTDEFFNDNDDCNC